MKIPLPTARQRIVSFAIVVAVTLYAGLHPRGYDFQNHVVATRDGDGLTFEKYGIAFTDPVIDAALASSLNKDGFEVSLILGAETEKPGGFVFIAQIHSGDDRTQLVVARWSDQLIVMNGDDYRSRFKHPRISVRIPESQRRKGVEVLITSGPGGSMIEVKDHIIVRRSDVILRVPSAPEPGRIVLGNSVERRHSWSGEIQRFEIRSIAENTDPAVVLDMGRYAAGNVLNSGTIGGELHVPGDQVILERGFLSWPINHQFEVNQSFVNDFVLNLFGFMPFGLALTGVLRSRGMELRRCAVLVVVVAALVSLLIEYVQTWFPSRSSSSLDLLLNIFGGGLGVMAWSLIFRSVPETKKAGQPDG